MSENLLQKSCSSALVGPAVELLLGRQATQRSSGAKLAELPPSTGEWLLQLALATGLLQGAILRRPQLQCPIPSPRPSSSQPLLRLHVTSLGHP